MKTYSIIQASKVGLCSNILRVHYHTLSFRALSKIQNWSAGPLPDQSFWKWNRIFPRVFFMDTHLLCAYHFLTGVIVLIKSKILNATGIGLASQFWQMESTLSFEWTTIFIFRSKSDLVENISPFDFQCTSTEHLTSWTRLWRHQVVFFSQEPRRILLILPALREGEWMSFNFSY